MELNKLLNYYVQYNVSNGVFLTFKNNLNKRSFCVSHSQKKIDSMKNVFPYSKYESTTKENFIAACLYIMYTKNPSSINKMLDYLREIPIDESIKFKNDIIQYSTYIQKDVVYLREKYSNPSNEQMIFELKNSNIKFYTYYFYSKINNIDIDTTIASSRITGNLVQRVKQLMLFVTFKEEAIQKINALLEESALMKGNW